MAKITSYEGYRKIVVICQDCGCENEIDLPGFRDYGLFRLCDCGAKIRICRDDVFGDFRVEGCFIKKIT